jgi:NAD(P)-dependent dehydrogenase (short-subunit alcohol dehydrogenase family)
MPDAQNRRTVIVSGGTYGIGRAIVLELARQGWRVIAFGLEAKQPGSAAQQGIAGTRVALEAEGLQADLLEADTANAQDVARVVAFAVAKHGGADALVNNAAIRPTGTILDTDEATFDRTLAVNLKGPFLLCREVIPILRARGGGTIVNIGSGAGRGKPGILAYSASKGGVFALSAALAQDHEADGIRVNVVVPAPGTPSGMVEAMQAAGAPGAGVAGSAEEVAREVAFLLSDEAHDISGSVRDLGNDRKA